CRRAPPDPVTHRRMRGPSGGVDTAPSPLAVGPEGHDRGPRPDRPHNRLGATSAGTTDLIARGAHRRDVRRRSPPARRLLIDHVLVNRIDPQLRAKRGALQAKPPAEDVHDNKTGSIELDPCPKPTRARLAEKDSTSDFTDVQN